MTHDALFAKLNDNSTIDGLRHLLRKHLLERLEAYNREPAKGEAIAYSIAGLMATKAIMNLPKADPYEEVFYIASQLELPASHRDQTATWEKLASVVQNLPSTP
jgi:hypothetical protein